MTSQRTSQLLSQSLSILLPLGKSTTTDDSDEWEYEYSATETEVILHPLQTGLANNLRRRTT